MAKRSMISGRFETPTTAATVECSRWIFADMNGEGDSEVIATDILVSFNGLAGEVGSRIVVARNATLAQKQAAVRNRVNSLLADLEPGNTLNNANIQISGLPV